MKKISLNIAVVCCAMMMACSPQGEGDQTGGSVSDDQEAPSRGQSTTLDEVSDPNILQVAIGSPDHTTLVVAVQAAELEDVLSNNGPLTVFAPVNSAFEALPEGTVETLLKPENKAVLARIIKFHAAPGTYTGDGLKDGSQLFMASGHYVPVTNVDGKITVNGSEILGTVVAANGVVHVVGDVFLPPDEE
jgi:uncharacterized surface protein with fasciclin (FAS1) repeats